LPDDVENERIRIALRSSTEIHEPRDAAHFSAVRCAYCRPELGRLITPCTTSASCAKTNRSADPYALTRAVQIHEGAGCALGGGRWTRDSGCCPRDSHLGLPTLG
jgi:hypothetical protein